MKPEREVAILLTLIELKAMLRVLAVTARFEREEDEEDAYQSHFTTSEEFDQAARRKKKDVNGVNRSVFRDDLDTAPTM